MRTRAILMAWAFAAYGTAALSPASAAPQVGTIVAVEGRAVAVGEDGAERILALKAPVYMNDRLVTSGASRLQLLLDDDSVVSQGESSEMVIDRYVYSPDQKDADCLMNFAAGLFRVVTGKIVSLSPERFKVRTRMATIGIRGCEVGFVVEDGMEDVYILWLPSGKSIFVETGDAANAAPGMSPLPDSMNITEAGTAVSIAAGARLQTRALSPPEISDFYRRVAIGRSSPPSAGGTAQPAAGLPQGRSISNEGRSVADDAVLRTATASGWTPFIPTGGGNAEPASRPDSRPGLDSFPSDQDTPTGGPGGEGPSSGPPGDTTPPPLPLPPTPVAQAFGNGWLWVIYSDGTMDNSYSPGFKMSDLDFQALKAGSVLLSGTGQAAAFVKHSLGDRLLSGTCNLTVQTGVSPTWTGVFDMRNGTDSLNFQAYGSIATMAQLFLNNLGDYNLTVNGQSFGPLTISDKRLINSYLVGPGGPTPSGVHGHLFFAHGSTGDPRVDCMFGGNLH